MIFLHFSRHPSLSLKLGVAALVASLLAGPAAVQGQTAAGSVAGPAGATALSLAEWKAQVRAFAGTFAADPEIPTEWAEQVLTKAQYNNRVKRLMTPAPDTTSTVRDWQAYRARLVSTARIEAGVLFWRRHQRTLEAVQAQWGVPASVVVGIIGIETAYGQNMGNTRVLDALATLAFDYPHQHPRVLERGQYFRKELEQFLRLCRSNGLDPLAVSGSFAGAMGIGQFMPSSWLLYGEDFDRDGTVNLIGSNQDAIASVANYLRAHGWKAGQPAYFPVALQADAEQMKTLLAPDILPTFDAAALASLGAQLPPEGRRYAGQMALVELKNGDKPPEYVIGTENFYAVTRYNQSSYYALAVLQLGEAIQQRVQQSAPQVVSAPQPQQ